MITSKNEKGNNMSYKPKTEWGIEGNLVYNLRDTDCYKNGRRLMQNDVAINIEMRHLPEDIQAEIALIVCSAMNTHYFKNRIVSAF